MKYTVAMIRQDVDAESFGEALEATKDLLQSGDYKGTTCHVAIQVTGEPALRIQELAIDQATR